MGVLRITCDLDGLEGCWMNIEQQWSGRELAGLLEATETVADDGLYAILRRKVAACHIDLTDGTAIDDPAAITAERMLDADIALNGWLHQGLYLAIAQRRVLGNASARTSLPANANGKKMTTMPAPAAT